MTSLFCLDLIYILYLWGAACVKLGVSNNLVYDLLNLTIISKRKDIVGARGWTSRTWHCTVNLGSKVDRPHTPCTRTQITVNIADPLNVRGEKGEMDIESERVCYKLIAS